MPILFYRAFNQPSPPSAPVRPNSSTTLCVISLMMGGATLLVAWIPYLGLWAVPISFAGAVLAIVGIVIARAAGQRKVPWGAAGLLLCAVSVGVSFLSTAAWRTRPGAPGRPAPAPAQPAVDMRHTAGRSFAPPPVSRPVFVMPKLPTPDDVRAPAPVERDDPQPQ